MGVYLCCSHPDCEDIKMSNDLSKFRNFINKDDIEVHTENICSCHQYSPWCDCNPAFWVDNPKDLKEYVLRSNIEYKDRFINLCDILIKNNKSYLYWSY